MQTRQQKYAADVYTRVEKVKEDKHKHKKYGSMALQLPVLVRTAGLAQALSFLESRAPEGSANADLLRDLACTLGCADGNALCTAARNSDLMAYAHLTHQVMDALDWYKRFAQSVLHVESGTDDASEVQP